MVTVQVPVPVHAPLQPVKVEPAAGIAVNVTLPPGNPTRQAVGQLMPAGFDVTVPLPVPASVTVSVTGGTEPMNVAVTARAWFIRTVQVSAVPVHAPLHPRKREPA